ncbi:hypothetical protein QQP08_021970 [Theobroma cacao]|nr:hypothetical protein QQP08_021970 [Theobroma cacao]
MILQSWIPFVVGHPLSCKGDDTKICKVFSNKSNVHDDVRYETIDVGDGGSGLSGWSKSALLDEVKIKLHQENPIPKIQTAPTTVSI